MRVLYYNMKIIFAWNLTVKIFKILKQYLLHNIFKKVINMLKTPKNYHRTNNICIQTYKIIDVL